MRGPGFRLPDCKAFGTRMSKPRSCSLSEICLRRKLNLPESRKQLTARGRVARGVVRGHRFSGNAVVALFRIGMVMKRRLGDSKAPAEWTGRRIRSRIRRDWKSSDRGSCLALLSRVLRQRCTPAGCFQDSIPCGWQTCAQIMPAFHAPHGQENNGRKAELITAATESRNQGFFAPSLPLLCGNIRM